MKLHYSLRQVKADSGSCWHPLFRGRAADATLKYFLLFGGAYRHPDARDRDSDAIHLLRADEDRSFAVSILDGVFQEVGDSLSNQVFLSAHLPSPQESFERIVIDYDLFL